MKIRDEDSQLLFFQNPSKMNSFKREQSVNAPSESGFNMKQFHDTMDQANDSDSEEIPSKRLRQVKILK